MKKMLMVLVSLVAGSQAMATTPPETAPRTAPTYVANGGAAPVILWGMWNDQGIFIPFSATKDGDGNVAVFTKSTITSSTTSPVYVTNTGTGGWTSVNIINPISQGDGNNAGRAVNMSMTNTGVSVFPANSLIVIVNGGSSSSSLMTVSAAALMPVAPTPTATWFVVNTVATPLQVAPIPASTWLVNQGTPAAVANAWPTYLSAAPTSNAVSSTPVDLLGVSPNVAVNGLLVTMPGVGKPSNGSATDFMISIGAYAGATNNTLHAEAFGSNGIQSVGRMNLFGINSANVGPLVTLAVPSLNVNSQLAYSVQSGTPIFGSWLSSVSPGGAVPIAGFMVPVMRGNGASATWFDGQPFTYTPTGANLDPGLVVADQVNILNTVTATGASGGAVTLTLPAPTGNNFQHIVKILIEAYAAASLTPGATQITVTTTQLNSLDFIFATTATQGNIETENYEPSRPIKAQTAASAVTIVCPATTGVIWHVVAMYYNAP